MREKTIEITGNIEFSGADIKAVFEELDKKIEGMPEAKIDYDRRGLGLVEPSTVEFVGRPDPDRTTPFELIPLCIFVLSIGMAMGKYVL